jgi:uncharacterized membrane protein YfcA
MSPLEYALLAVAAALGGSLNSVAGGGSFLTFPALVFVGVPPVVANATSAVALWPGSVAGAFAYREELPKLRGTLVPFAVVSALGGLAGAVLLVRTSDATFVALLPFLLLVASLVFTFGGSLTSRLGQHATRSARLAVLSLQLVVSVYGGYFGGGMGILMLAAFSAMGMTHIHTMNALKTVLATLINGVAIASFVAAGVVDWGPGLVMVTAGLAGGYLGADRARRLPPEQVRRFVLGVAWAMTAWFFWKAYG